MNAVIIARVSTEEQKEAGNSLPAQITRLETYCQRKDLEIIKKFSFDESAYKDQRTDFDSILDFVIDQKEKVAVCFDKVDRLSRNIFDKRVSMLYEKALKDEIELHFVSDGQVINSHLSATEKFAFSMSLGLAKYYSDAISDNVKRAQEQMLRSGTYPCKPPYGYIRKPISKDKTEIEVDEFTSKIVKKAFELYATSSFSIELVRRKLKDDYGINWSKGFTDKVLKDKFYIGVMTWNNKEYKHKYLPIITESLFTQVQDIKAGFCKKPFKYAGIPYIYRGLLRCGHCGLAITPEKHKGHIYYHCTQYNGKHGAEWLTEENITEQLGEVFKRLQVPEHVLNQIVDALKTSHESKVNFREDQYRQLTADHERITKRIERAYDDRLDGRITESEYDKYSQSAREKISEIDTRLGMLQEAEDSYYITARYLLELAKRANELFQSSEVEERRQLIKLVLSNPKVEGKIIKFDLVKPFDTIANYSHRQSGLPIRQLTRTLREIFLISNTISSFDSATLAPASI